MIAFRKKKDFSMRAFKESSDEIGALVDSFNEILAELERREEEITQAQENLKRYVNLVDKYVITSSTDQVGKIVYSSEAFSKISKYSKEELIGKPHKIVRHPDMPKSVYKKLWQTIQSGNKWSGEILNRAKDGSHYWVYTNIEPDFDSEGTIIGYTSIRQDITDKKRIKQFSMEMEEAKRQAESANKMKSEFLSSMSHEIRTPMNGVIGTITLLSETELSQKQKKYLSIMENSAKVLLETINETLDYSEIEAGKVNINQSVFSMHKLIEESFYLYEALANNKNLNYEIIFDANLPEYFLGDSFRIKQITSNLISNAIKFTESGEVLVEVSRCSTNNKSILISVKDTGRGVSKDKQELIFDAFEKSSEGIKASGVQGTGLGLSISKKLVELMNGEIGVKNNDGKGAVFWFSLPLSIPSQEQIESIKIKTSLDNEVFRRNILVVEDDDTNQFIMAEILNKLGCSVNIASNGKEAIKMVDDYDYDLIFMDCNMPIMDGYEATAKIRELGMTEIPIIALTADAFVDNMKKCFEAGLNDFLTKPLSKESVVTVLEEWLNRT